jgi:V8-like Glu-specific endopeptidase
MLPNGDERDALWFLARMPKQSVLADVLRGDSVNRLLGIARDRAIANGGLVALPRADADQDAIAAMLALATAAVARMSEQGEQTPLTDDEKAALDVFIILVARPAIFVRDGRVYERPENWPEIGRIADEVLPRIVAGVGRIETSTHFKTGSGFIVGEHRVLTNNHVVATLAGHPADKWQTAAQLFAERCDAANGKWADDPATQPFFELRGELGSDHSSTARVTRILFHHSEVDMAVLELDSDPEGGRRVSLMNSEPDGFQTRRVYAIGYPVDDARDWLGNRVTPTPIFQRIFGADEASLGTKRFSPGTIVEWGGGNVFDHDASTLRGSSGSCIVDFEHRRAVGLHFGGRYKDHENWAVPLWKFRDDLTAHGVVFD